MSNIVQLARFQHQRSANRVGKLAQSFAQDRRSPNDVFWLKENAELLGILRITGTGSYDDLLAVYDPIYRNLTRKFLFFPQYYRFFLAIALDLEEMGMDGKVSSAVTDVVRNHGLAEAELSDLQRMEAQVLCGRAQGNIAFDPDLEARMRAFVSSPDKFALPNKKAAYELTHAVFYLSHFGAVDPQLGEPVERSLHFAGLVAYLEQNIDLLAEICIALGHIGAGVPDLWQRALSSAFGMAHVFEEGSASDDYHAYLVTYWALTMSGLPPEQLLPRHGGHFAMPNLNNTGLHQVSGALFELDNMRSSDWGRMQPILSVRLTEPADTALQSASQSSVYFEEFFAQFARAIPA